MIAEILQQEREWRLPYDAIWPLPPNPFLSLVYAMSELGEVFDVYARRHHEGADRNHHRQASESDFLAELGDTLMMAGLALLQLDVDDEMARKLDGLWHRELFTDREPGEDELLALAAEHLATAMSAIVAAEGADRVTRTSLKLQAIDAVSRAMVALHGVAVMHNSHAAVLAARRLQANVRRRMEV